MRKLLLDHHRLAGLIATVGKKPVSNPVFIGCVVIASAAFVILLLAGLPDLFCWLGDGQI